MGFVSPFFPPSFRSYLDQRRATGDVEFYKDWTAYKTGFGALTGDFWLGNDAIHALTDQVTL